MAAGYYLVKESLPSRRGSSGVKVNKGKITWWLNVKNQFVKVAKLTITSAQRNANDERV